MLFQDMELYNVAELGPAGPYGQRPLLRVPWEVARHLNPSAQQFNLCNCGVELRFNLLQDTVRIRMCTNESGKFARQYVYFGDTCAPWAECVKTVGSEPTEIVIHRPDFSRLEKRAAAVNSGWDPHLVRLILLNASTSLLDVRGKVSPPRPGQTPDKKILFYGSSITHGSLALSQVDTYPFLTAENLGMDQINLGYAGSAWLEPEMADYIAGRTDADLVVLELGINLLPVLTAEQFGARVKDFVGRISRARPATPIFCTDLFYCESDLCRDGQAAAFRAALRQALRDLAAPNVVHMDGCTLLTGPAGLSADLVHPNVHGARQIAESLCRVIRGNLDLR